TYLASRGQRQPRGEMLGRSPAAQVGTAFGNQSQCQVRTDAVDLRHINTRQLVQNGAHVKADGVRLDRAVPGLRQGSTRTCLLRAERSEHRLDLRITFVDTGLIKVVERQRLGEREDVLRLVVP